MGSLDLKLQHGAKTCNSFNCIHINFSFFNVTACHNPNVDQPFMCVDLMFITILLEDGYGLKPDTKLKVRNFIVLQINDLSERGNLYTLLLPYMFIL